MAPAQAKGEQNQAISRHATHYKYSETQDLIRVSPFQPLLPLASKVETSRRTLKVEVRVERRPDRSEPSGLGGGAKVGRGEDGRQRACKAEREDQRRVRRYQL